MATLQSSIPASSTRPRDGISPLILRLNGAFLLIASSLGVTAEVLSHFWGIGPWGHIYLDSPYTLGFFEAHGLAFLIGLLIFGAGPPVDCLSGMWSQRRLRRCSAARMSCSGAHTLPSTRFPWAWSPLCCTSRLSEH